MIGLSQLEHAKNQNALAQYQISSAQRADQQQRDFLEAASQPGFKFDVMSAIKGGPAALAAYKAQQDAFTNNLTNTKLQGEINKNTFDLNDKQLTKEMMAITRLNSPKDVLATINDSLSKGTIDQPRANQLINDLNTMSFDQFKATQIKNLTTAHEQMLDERSKSNNAATVAATNRGQDMTSESAKQTRLQAERHFQQGGYTYDLDRGVRIDRNGVATPLMQQAPGASAPSAPLAAPVASAGGNVLQGKAPAQTSNLIPLGPRPTRVTANELRDEVNTLNKDFRVVQDAHTKIKNVADTGAGDMSLLYSFVKLLDPGSVVRESEFAAAAQSGSFGERVQGAVERVISGKRLTGTLRQDFINEANNLYTSQKSGADRVIKHYSDIAKRSGINSEDVIVPYAAPEIIPDQAPPGAVRRK
jgi:hypothetical protein